MVESQAFAVLSTCLAFGIYFAGPLGLLVCVAPSRARANLFPFVVGMTTFLLAWMWIACLLGLWARLGTAAATTALAYALAFSAFAGVFEESFRYVALRIVNGKIAVVDWKTALAYAAGHAGGESILVGITRLGSPGFAAPALVEDAVYHLLGAFIVHACFTAVVLHAVLSRRLWPLFVAMLWHFGQDMFGPAARALCGEYVGSVLYFGTNFTVYPCLLVATLRRWFPAAATNTSAQETTSSPDRMAASC
ncbi:MAG: YhfC family intramembrane metalloprotease [Planctomycetia bacterium]|nr:YhfC family intramembrane metalloprotease [Planctomycetia bacterium]